VNYLLGAVMNDKTPESLAAALAAFQAELPRIGKDNTAQVKSDKGSYSYRYADLTEVSAVILPLLARYGMAWMTLPTLNEAGAFVLRYTLSHISGDKYSGDYPLPSSSGSPQMLGSAITYARRYALCAATGVAPGGDDDDAAATQERQVERPEQTAEQRSVELRGQIAVIVKSQGKTIDQGAEDFAVWSRGTDIRSASVAVLAEYKDHLQRAGAR
jgi:hypothetical protein